MYICRGCMFIMLNVLEIDDRILLIKVGIKEFEIMYNKKIIKEIWKEKVIEYVNFGLWFELMRMYGF